MTIDNSWNVSKTTREYKYIVLHHTATTKCMTAEEMKQSMFYTWVQNRWAEYIPTHYIVWCSWDWIKVNELDRIVWATLNPDANANWIHIEIVWDFNNGTPSQSQYDTVNQLIYWIKEKYPDMQIKWHKDFQAKNCPGVNFDWSKIKTWWIDFTKQQPVPQQTQPTDTKRKTFSLSRYYSVMPNQSRYYNWRTYEQDFAINCSGDPMVTSDWHQLNDNEWWKVVACPKDIKLWTKLYIEWIWEVTCHDRWWKIIKQWDTYRIDLWMWVWQAGLDRIYNNSIKWWIYKWYVLD